VRGSETESWLSLLKKKVLAARSAAFIANNEPITQRQSREREGGGDMNNLWCKNQEDGNILARDSMLEADKTLGAEMILALPISAKYITRAATAVAWRMSWMDGCEGLKCQQRFSGSFSRRMVDGD
jgi:hypothetical protein